MLENPSENRKKILRRGLVRISHPKELFFVIGKKTSTTKVFQNERLFWIDPTHRIFSYSHVPKCIDFDNGIDWLSPKESLYLDTLTDFKLKFIDDYSIELSWKEKKLRQWILTFSTVSCRNDVAEALGFSDFNNTSNEEQFQQIKEKKQSQSLDEYKPVRMNITPNSIQSKPYHNIPSISWEKQEQKIVLQEKEASKDKKIQDSLNQRFEEKSMNQDSLAIYEQQPLKIKSSTQSIDWNILWSQSKQPLFLFEQFVTKSKQLCSEQHSTTFSSQGIIIRPFVTTTTEPLSLQNQHQRSDYFKQLHEIEQKSNQHQQHYNDYQYLYEKVRNSQMFRVPIICYIEDGVYGYQCEGELGNSWSKVTEQEFVQGMRQLEGLVGELEWKKISLWRRQQGPYMIVKNANETLLPEISYHPINSEVNFLTYLPLQFLHQHAHLPSSPQQLHTYILTRSLPFFISQFTSQQFPLLTYPEIKNFLNTYGLTANFFYHVCMGMEMEFGRNFFLSMLCAKCFCSVVKNQIRRAGLQDRRAEVIRSWIKSLFEFQEEDIVWEVITEMMEKLFGLKVLKEKTIPGIILLHSLHVLCFQVEPINEISLQYAYIKSDIFPPSVRFQPTKPHVKKLIKKQLEEQVDELPLTQQIENWETELEGKLNFLKAQTYPYKQHRQLLIYKSLRNCSPPCYWSFRLCASTIEGLLAEGESQQAQYLLTHKTEELSFWLGEFHPYLLTLYDLFLQHSRKKGNYPDAVKYCKVGLLVVVKVWGEACHRSSQLPERQTLLAEIYLHHEQYQQGLKQLQKAKFHYQQLHPFQPHLLHYSKTVLRISEVHLTINNPYTTIKQLQTLLLTLKKPGHEQIRLKVYEVLYRANTILKNFPQRRQIIKQCSDNFNSCQNPYLFKKMLRLALSFELERGLEEEKSYLLELVLEALWERGDAITEMEAFTFLNKKAMMGMKILPMFYKSIHEINHHLQPLLTHKLLKYHQPLTFQPQNPTQELLVFLQAVTSVVGYHFLLPFISSKYSY